MDFSESTLEIIKCQNCPIYSLGEEFKVAGRSIFLQGKPTCLTLMSDITEALVKCQGLSMPKQRKDEYLFCCSGYMSGCVGKIHIKYTRERKIAGSLTEQKESSDISTVRELINFSVFKTLSEPEIIELAAHFKTKDFRKNEIILRKGDRGEKFYIILSGRVEIIGDYGVSIATLGKGEVFGEMSLLTGSPVSAKVRAVEDTKTMYMFSNYFRLMLNRFSPLQMYFTRLLAKRLSQANIDRTREVAAGMTGNLSEISPAELLQALNMSQKTGVLSLTLPKGTARLLLNSGELISVRYDEWAGEKAFFEILKERRGDFKFKPSLPAKDVDTPPMGNFMYLLMEGMRRMDEESGEGEDRISQEDPEYHDDQDEESGRDDMDDGEELIFE